MSHFSENFAVASPRLARRRVPVASVAVRGAVFTLTIGLLLLSFLPSIAATWSAGLALLLYDVALIVFTMHRVRRHTGAGSHDSAQIGALASRPSLTVILAAYNEVAVLPEAIERLLHQHEPPDAILIADDGSTDATPAALLDRFGLIAPDVGTVSEITERASGIRWLRLNHGGKARSLNDAIAFADTEIVLLLDADTLLEKNALRAMRDAFARDPQLVAATGVIEPFTRPSLIGSVLRSFQALEYRRNALMSHAWQRDNALQLIAGAFVGFRKDVLLAIGGFDPNCLAEDYELAHRLHRHALEQGLPWTVGIVGEAIAYTEAPSTLIALMRQRRRWFGGFLQTHWWNRDLIANPQFGRLGTRLMVVKTLDAVQPIVGLAATMSLTLSLITGEPTLFAPALFILLIRTTVSLAWAAWSLKAYRLWTSQSPTAFSVVDALAGLAEPWAYRIIRHIGELWGWLLALHGDSDWSPARASAGVSNGKQTDAAYPAGPDLQPELAFTLANDVNRPKVTSVE